VVIPSDGWLGASGEKKEKEGKTTKSARGAENRGELGAATRTRQTPRVTSSRPAPCESFGPEIICRA